MLISEQYRDQQKTLHDAGNYGTASVGYAPLVSQIINKLEIGHLLDYGCGSNLSLAKSLKVDHKIKYQAYDPCVPKYASEPTPAEMVACVDVLEHIEPDCIDSVLDHLESLVEGVLFVSIHTGDAVKVLPDGRNAHILQRPMEWWLPKIWERFDVQTVQVTGPVQFYVVAYAKEKHIESTDGGKLS